MINRTLLLALAFLTSAACVHASEAGRTSASASAAYKCDSDAGMSIIATTTDFATPAAGPDQHGYQQARTGRQTFRCEGGPTVSVEVSPPQSTGECGGDGRVVITDITYPGWRTGTELIEFNKRCFFSDYITKVIISRQDSHYSVERCSERNALNKQAFIGCTTTSTAKEASP